MNESWKSISINWQQFHSFLLQRMTKTTASDRLCYAKQYANLPPSELLQLPPNKRLHVQKALSCLARFTGRYDIWRSLLQKNGLSWSTGTEKIDAFTRFFDSDKSLDTMLQWLRDALKVLPSKYANLLLFCTLTGMRGSECVEAVRLLNRLPIAESLNSQQYYNPERQILQHYLYPQIFIRRTKAIYISVVNDDVVGIAKKVGQNPVSLD